MGRKRKGIEFERRVLKTLREQGYYAVRSAGSFGTFDIIAVKQSEVLGVQCKMDGYLPPEEREEMVSVGEDYGIKPYLAYRRKEGRKFVIVLEPVPKK